MSTRRTVLMCVAAGMASFALLGAAEATDNDASASIKPNGEILLAQAGEGRGKGNRGPGASSAGRSEGGKGAAAAGSSGAPPVARAARSGGDKASVERSGRTTSVRGIREGGDRRVVTRRSGTTVKIIQRDLRRDGVKSRGGRTVIVGRNRGTRHAWGPGALFWFYDGYYHGDCSWLRRKAEATGSRLWWRRFRQCRASS